MATASPFTFYPSAVRIQLSPRNGGKELESMGELGTATRLVTIIGWIEASAGDGTPLPS